MKYYLWGYINMLRITLYENCILNNTYRNVISTALKSDMSVLDRYLSSLTKKTFDVDNVYQENSGRFVFSYDIDLKNIYNYNYMKVETIDVDEDEEETLKIKRYCFVNSIQLKNGNVYLEYAEDYWSSYSDKITGITESYLSRARVLKYSNKTISLRKVPVAYDGNNALTITSLLPSGTLYLSVLCQIQYYNTDAQGNYTERYVKNFLISPFELTSKIDYTLANNHKVQDIIENIISNQSVKQLTLNGTTFDYEVGDFYVFPSDFYYLTEETQNNNYIDLGSGIKIYVFEMPVSNMASRQTYTVAKNDKLLSVGTISSQIDVINNGTSMKFDVLITNTREDFGIHLSGMNKLVDITNDFAITPAISSLKSEELSLYKLQRETKNAQLLNEKKVIETKYDYSTNYGASDIMADFTGSGLRVDRFPSQLFKTISTGIKLEETQNLLNINKENINLQLELVNAPLYTSNKGVFGNNVNFVNALRGICTFAIDSENDTYVRETINNFGYSTFEYLDALTEINFANVDYFTNNNINYNVIKFEELELYGSFTQEICSILKEILTSGIKLWYNETLAKDNNPSPYV